MDINGGFQARIAVNMQQSDPEREIHNNMNAKIYRKFCWSASHEFMVIPNSCVLLRRATSYCILLFILLLALCLCF